MAGRIILDACNPALDANGAIDTGATLEFFLNRTTEQQAVYSTAAYADLAGVAGTLENPLSPDSSGRFPEIWGPNGSVYTVEWTPTGESAITFDDIALAAPPEDAELYEHFYKFKAGVLTNSEVLFIANIVQALTLPENLNDGIRASIFTVGVNPTATMTIKLYKNGSEIGHIAFSTAGVATVTFTDEVELIPGDQLSAVGQATADVTGALLAMTLVARVS